MTNNIFLQDVQNRIDNNPEKTRLLLSKHGVETPEPTLKDVALAYRKSPSFLKEFYQMTNVGCNAGDEVEESEKTNGLSWTDWGGGVAAALSALFASINNSKNAEQNAELQMQALKTKQSEADANAKKSSTTIWIIGLVLVVVVVGVIIYLSKKK